MIAEGFRSQEEQEQTPGPKNPAVAVLERGAQFVLDAALGTSPAVAAEGGRSEEEEIKRWYNNGGVGPQTEKYVSSFLNMMTGVTPAAASQSPLVNGEASAVEALRASWATGSQGLSTAPMPQVAADVPAELCPRQSSVIT